VLCLGFFATGVIPEYQTSLMFFLACMLLSPGPAKVVFAGFMSGAFWLVFGGLILGVAIKNTGLGEKLAKFISDTAPPTYKGIITGVVLSGVLLSFLMPSSLGRLVLFMPIALAVAEHCGFPDGSNGRTGIVLAAAFGSTVPAFAILPANVPNMVLAGTAESVYGIHLLYGEYLTLFFPVFGILKAVSIIWLILYLYPDSPKVTSQPSVEKFGLSPAQKKLALLLGGAVLLWMGDSLHGISPAWIALGAALFLMVPGNGITENKDYLPQINFGPLFFVAGIMGLGAVIAHFGMGTWLASAFIRLLPESPSSFESYLYLSLMSAITGLFATLPGVPAVLTPMAETLSETTKLPIQTILFTQVVGFSTMFLPYQAPPILVGIRIAGVELKVALKTGFLLAVITITLFYPLQYFWWNLINPFTMN
jgi:di/tricarboxylate transporter